MGNFVITTGNNLVNTRDYARGRHEPRNRFRPADVAVFLPGKGQECRPNFPQSTVFDVISIYTRVIS